MDKFTKGIFKTLLVMSNLMFVAMDVMFILEGFKYTAVYVICGLINLGAAIYIARKL
jgi:hypothetical protein